jgi:hypothetical protein
MRTVRSQVGIPFTDARYAAIGSLAATSGHPALAPRSRGERVAEGRVRGGEGCIESGGVASGSNARGMLANRSDHRALADASGYDEGSLSESRLRSMRAALSIETRQR